jgi:hypothetical protein
MSHQLQASYSFHRGIHPNNGYQDVQVGGTVMLSIALLTARKKQKQVQ